MVVQIYDDLCREENQTAWKKLEKLEIALGRSRIEMFDMIWWDYVSETESAKGRRIGRESRWWKKN